MAVPVLGGAANDAAERARRRRTFRLLTIALALGLIELLSGLGLRWLRAKGAPVDPVPASGLTGDQTAVLERMLRGEAFYQRHDPELGWTLRPGAEQRGERANAEGFRSDREYAPLPPSGTARIVVSGDSFTHCDDVSNAEAWPAVMERTAGIPLEVLNLGVPGYGTDQALLRWRRLGRGRGAAVAVLGVMSENIYRVVNTFRPFYQPRGTLPFAKPRFLLEGEGLRLLENPLPSLDAYRDLLARPAETLARVGAHDHFYGTRAHDGPHMRLQTVRLVSAIARISVSDGIRDPFRPGVVRFYDERSEAFEVLARICETFADDARAAGATPVVVLFPKRSDVEDRRAHDQASYAPLRDRLERRKILVADMGAPLLLVSRMADERGERWEERLFQRGGHYSTYGNEVVAEEMLGFLRERGLIPRRE